MKDSYLSLKAVSSLYEQVFGAEVANHFCPLPWMAERFDVALVKTRMSKREKLFLGWGHNNDTGCF